jgi:hypothetical protein
MVETVPASLIVFYLIASEQFFISLATVTTTMLQFRPMLTTSGFQQ